MTRVFLAAGVAALAIAAPANAGPHGGGGRGQQADVQHGRGGGGGQRAQTSGGGGRHGGGQRMEAFGGGGHGRGGFAAPRMQRQSFAMHGPGGRGGGHAQMRAERQQFRNSHAQAQARIAQRQAHGNRAQAQSRVAERQQLRANRAQAQNRVAERQQMRIDRQQQVQAQIAQRQQLRGNRALANNVNPNVGANHGVGYGVGGCPPGLANKGCTPPGLAMNVTRVANADAFRTSRLASLAYGPRTSILAPAQAYGYVGAPISTVRNVIGLQALPNTVQYLYPDTPAYYYQYGDGYLYQVDRGTNLISALLPLLTGGYMPGQYLPNYYMSSYVPSYYGLNSFYPASYGFDYGGYGYNNLCNRYVNGVIYQVDCATGMIADAVPVYAGGYGVGQMLPSAYGYYNVPSQYRNLYYNTADAGYWYAPGAIYQYDPRSSLITSVAALMSPGFTVGQALPMGYDVYNVPYAYRATYYDTPNAWYRYNNGYIYQVDPATQLVTAIVASILT